MPEQHAAFLESRLGGGGSPNAVLVGAGLHREQGMKGVEVVVLRNRGVVGRRVEPAADEFRALEPHDSPGFRPAAVVADEHAHGSAIDSIDGKAKIARLEIPLFEMLERTLRFVFLVPGQMHLSVFADDAARLVDQN